MDRINMSDSINMNDSIITMSEKSTGNCKKGKIYKQRFRDEWLQDSRFKDWLRKLHGNQYRAFCGYCQCTLACHKRDIQMHCLSKKHRKKEASHVMFAGDIKVLSNVPHTTVDLRSDTNTVPTSAMYNAMTYAAVGNDVFGEDPTVNRLERECAKMLGKDDSLFVPTGTMGNLLAIMVHCQKQGSEILVGDKSHIFRDEQGGSAQFAHAHSWPLTNLPDGTFDLDEMKSKIRDSSDFHEPRTSLICLENTHNKCGGKVVPLTFMEQVYEFARKEGIPVHLDGSRIWNAATALNVPVSEVAKYCSSVNVCFSKGLGCPVGSLLAGSQAFIDKARRSRKALGGGMRQAGVLAGAVLYALDNVLPHLHEDHRRAKTLAAGLAAGGHPGILVDVDGVETNMVNVSLDTDLDVGRICARLKKVELDTEIDELGEAISVVVDPSDRHVIRFVTYVGITDSHIEKAIRKWNHVFYLKSLLH